MNELGNATFENYVGLEQGYSEMAYQMVSHVLTLGYAVMLASLLYFVLISKAEGYVYERNEEKTFSSYNYY